MTKQPRQITKYPNRRLYDTCESRYVTLLDIRKFVIDRKEFTVTDKKTQEDITERVLLQVMLEQEQSGGPVLTREFLLHTIRGYEVPGLGANGDSLPKAAGHGARGQMDI